VLSPSLTLATRSSPHTRGSSARLLWIPAFAGMTGRMAPFYHRFTSRRTIGALDLIHHIVTIRQGQYRHAIGILTRSATLVTLSRYTWRLELSRQAPI